MTQSESERTPHSDKQPPSKGGQSTPGAGQQPSQKGGQQPRSRRRSRKKRRKSTKPKGGPTPSTLDAAVAPTVAAFMGCGRCSFFLAGYRALLGTDAFIAQVGTPEDNWVTLAWRPELTGLIEKSYGIEFEDGLFYLEHACRECGRVLAFELDDDAVVEESADATPDVRIRVLAEQ